MSVETITFGCRLNFAESETLAALAPKGEHWTIVNSCAVTNEAVRHTRQAIRRAHRQRPDARILVTGCAAELDLASFEQMAGVVRVSRNASKLNAFATNDVMPPPVPAGLLHKVKSFVAIQTGCDHRCTVCLIWQARGPSRSYPFEAVRDAVERELDRGAKEIVLTGVDITDVAGGLGNFCQRLLAAIPTLKRLQLSSLHSVEMDDALFELIAGEPRLMPHFHLSLQAGDDMILKRMKRLLVSPEPAVGGPPELEPAAFETRAITVPLVIPPPSVIPEPVRPEPPAPQLAPSPAAGLDEPAAQPAEVEQKPVRGAPSAPPAVPAAAGARRRRRLPPWVLAAPAAGLVFVGVVGWLLIGRDRTGEQGAGAAALTQLNLPRPALTSAGPIAQAVNPILTEAERLMFEGNAAAVRALLEKLPEETVSRFSSAEAELY